MKSQPNANTLRVRRRRGSDGEKSSRQINAGFLRKSSPFMVCLCVPKLGTALLQPSLLRKGTSPASFPEEMQVANYFPPKTWCFSPPQKNAIPKNPMDTQARFLAPSLLSRVVQPRFPPSQARLGGGWPVSLRDTPACSCCACAVKGVWRFMTL